MSDATTTTADPNDIIREAMLNPQSVAVKSTNITERPIADLIAAQRHLANEAAGTGRNHQGLRFSKIVPPGCG